MNSNLVEIGSESENAFVEGELKIIHNHSLYPTSLVVRGVSTVEFWITYSEMNIRNLHTVQLHSYILLLPIFDEASLYLRVSPNVTLTLELIFINLINELRHKHSNTNVILEGYKVNFLFHFLFQRNLFDVLFSIKSTYYKCIYIRIRFFGYIYVIQFYAVNLILLCQ